ncbi:DUF1361 domain-containing protein [Nocardia sp. NPDC056611]|uniref:DUF1361 domain-containing protein n=1 Tax=Nocardia sp. NPDC056611 TaxID=3345877 RepID=UPI00366E45A6
MRPGVLLLLCVLGLNTYALLLIYMRSRIYRVPVYRPMAWNFRLTASIGIYLGRYLRLDSWDVRSPAQLRAKLREHFDSNAARGRFAFFCVTHTIFLGLMYGLIVSPLVDSMAHG